MINVVSLSTSERKQEIVDLFNEIKPLLDKGYSYNKAVREVKKMNTISVSHYRWFKDVVRYGESQGYPYKDYQRCR